MVTVCPARRKTEVPDFLLKSINHNWMCLQSMVKGVLEALAACHQNGWCINGLQLSNRVVLANNSWKIKDAEKARRSGSTFPEMRGQPKQSTCRPSTDLLILSQMRDTLATSVSFDKMLCTVHALLRQQKRSAEELLHSRGWPEVKCHGQNCILS